MGQTPHSNSLHRPRNWAASLLTCLATLLAFCAFAPAVEASTDQQIGVQTHLLWGGVSDAGVAEQLDRTRASGAEIIRLDVGWASLQPEARGEWSQWALGRLDSAIDAANARGIKVLVTFWQSPCWASSSPERFKQGCEGKWWERSVQLWGPRRASDYANALATLVDRYGSRVEAWEIWSEPNSRAAYRTRRTVRSYVKLTKVANRKVKAADPQATVVAGALMWADFGFTERLYRAGIKGHFDAFSIHPYSDDRSPLDEGHPDWIRGSFVRGVPAVRKTMVKQGDAKPLWLTEFGWSTADVRGSSGWLNGVNESTQAAFTVDALDQISRWKYVDVAIYFKLIDTSSNPSDTVANFGLLRHDGTPKPAYHAFKAAAADFN